MSAQKDLISGYNFAPNAEASQENFEQAINGAAPLSNIGFVIVGTATPDVANNPRFIRYPWIDITDPNNTILKRYVGDRTLLNGTWEAVGVAAGSITTAMLASRSITGGVDIARIKANSGYTDSGNYYFLLRIAANGKDIEAVNLSTALQDGGGVPFTRIETTGIGTGKYLGSSGGLLGYKALDPNVDFTAALGNRINAAGSLSPGAADTFLMTNAAASACEFRTVANAIAAGALALNRLATTAAAANDIIRFSGSAWERVTPSLRTTNSDAANTGITVGALGAAAVFTQAHGLGAVPKLVRVVAVCTTIDVGFAVGDELDIMALRIAANNFNSAGISVDATSVTVTLAGGATGNEIPNKGTGVYAAMTEASWSLKIYAWV